MHFIIHLCLIQIKHTFEIYALSKLIFYSVDETYCFYCFVYGVKKKKPLYP